MKVDSKYLKEAVKDIMSRIKKDEATLVDTVAKLDTLSLLYRENRTFRNILLSPMVSLDDKLKVLKKLNSALKIDDDAYAVLVKVVSENKASIIKEIGKAFRFEVEKFFATLKGEVITAHPIDEELLAKIKNVVEAKLGKRVEFSVKEDPSLIAGAVIKAGSYVIDTSVKTFFKKLEQELSRF